MTGKPSLVNALPDQKFRFERHGDFVADLVGYGAGKAVFNRVTGMKDSWGK